MDPTRYPHVKTRRMIELEEMESRGWGSVPQFLMPRNWREVPGPYAALEDESEDEMPERIDQMRELRSSMARRFAVWSGRRA